MGECVLNLVDTVFAYLENDNADRLLDKTSVGRDLLLPC